MGLSQFPAPILTAVAAAYGASVYGLTASVSSGAQYISAASFSVTTTSANTKWLIEVDADLKWTGGGGSGTAPSECVVSARVDGGDYACSGGVGVGALTSAGYEMIELPVRGRLVVTLASIGTHSIAGGVFNGGSGGSITLKALAVTATQLAG